MKAVLPVLFALLVIAHPLAFVLVLAADIVQFAFTHALVLATVGIITAVAVLGIAIIRVVTEADWRPAPVPVRRTA